MPTANPPRACLLFLSALLIALAPLRAQTDKLRVGVAPVEPLVIAESGGVYGGLAIQLWESVAEKSDLTYDYVPCKRDSALARLYRGELDVYLTASPNTGTLDTLSHSPIYFSSNLAVASDAGGNAFLNVVRGLFQPRFFQIILALSILLLIVGLIIWAVERKANEGQFGGEGKAWRGIGAGFWWAGVTLTTIGYGDKAPVSFWGRMVAMLWMLVGLAVSATLTAALVSLAEGADARLSIPGDLADARNVVVEGHELIPFLRRLDLPYERVPDLGEAFRRVADGEADHVVANEMELDFYAANHSNDLTVQSTRLEPNYYAVGFRRNLPQADTLSALVTEVTESTAWPGWLGEYVPR